MEFKKIHMDKLESKTQIGRDTWIKIHRERLFIIRKDY